MKKLFLIAMCMMFVGCAGMSQGEKSIGDLLKSAEETGADQKLSELDPLAAAPAGTDYMYIVDDEATDVSKSITVAYLMSYLATNTAVITGGTIAPVTDAAADFAAAFTGANLYGGTFICDTAGTIQLPAIAVGMNFTIITKGAIAVSADTNASDLMVLDGVALDDGDKATNTSAAGDIIVFQYMGATGWVATSNGWTDGGA